MSRRPIGDAHNFQNLGKDRRTGPINWDKEAQLPRNDLTEQAGGAEPIPHRDSEAGQLNPVNTHYPRAPDLKTLGEFENGLAFHKGGESGVW
jgi:hypothetical protein